MARSAFAFALLAASVVAMAQGAMAGNHVVGGNLGWHVSRVEGDAAFYQEWADGDGPYQFRDTLEFRYTPGETILRVSGAGFANCNGAEALGSFHAGHTIFPLAQAGRVFFISADVTSCSVGLKFFVDVVA